MIGAVFDSQALLGDVRKKVAKAKQARAGQAKPWRAGLSRRDGDGLFSSGHPAQSAREGWLF